MLHFLLSVRLGKKSVAIHASHALGREPCLAFGPHQDFLLTVALTHSSSFIPPFLL